MQKKTVNIFRIHGKSDKHNVICDGSTDFKIK